MTTQNENWMWCPDTSSSTITTNYTNYQSYRCGGCGYWVTAPHTCWPMPTLPVLWSVQSAPNKWKCGNCNSVVTGYLTTEAAEAALKAHQKTCT